MATWNDNGSSYNTWADKGIMIVARMMMMLMVTMMMAMRMMMIFKPMVAVIQLIGTIKRIDKWSDDVFEQACVVKDLNQIMYAIQ